MACLVCSMSAGWLQRHNSNRVGATNVYSGNSAAAAHQDHPPGPHCSADEMAWGLCRVLSSSGAAHIHLHAVGNLPAWAMCCLVRSLRAAHVATHCQAGRVWDTLSQGSWGQSPLDVVQCTESWPAAAAECRSPYDIICP